MTLQKNWMTGEWPKKSVLRTGRAKEAKHQQWRGRFGAKGKQISVTANGNEFNVRAKSMTLRDSIFSLIFPFSSRRRWRWLMTAMCFSTLLLFLSHSQLLFTASNKTRIFIFCCASKDFLSLLEKGSNTGKHCSFRLLLPFLRDLYGEVILVYLQPFNKAPCLSLFTFLFHLRNVILHEPSIIQQLQNIISICMRPTHVRWEMNRTGM